MRSGNLTMAALLACLPISAAAQAGGMAHLYAYRVKDVQAFEQGYRRHLGWHATHGDALVWYAWYVTAGNRKGAFVDGTFGTTPEGLAGRPDPDGDGADFRQNAAPYATPLGDEGWELWRAASNAAALENRRPDPSIDVFVVQVDAATKPAFETGVAAMKTVPGQRLDWYRSDKTPGSYLLITPSRTPHGTTPSLSRTLHAVYGRSGGTDAILAQSRSIRAENWRYAPRLALIPGKPLVP